MPSGCKRSQQIYVVLGVWHASLLRQCNSTPTGARRLSVRL